MTPTSDVLIVGAGPAEQEPVLFWAATNAWKDEKQDCLVGVALTGFFARKKGRYVI